MNFTDTIKEILHGGQSSKDDKLSSKVIEIEDDGEKYIYQSANKNELVLQNTEKENDIYKKYFRKDEFEKLLQDRKVKINII